jgi:hypothetical protein
MVLNCRDELDQFIEGNVILLLLYWVT